MRLTLDDLARFSRASHDTNPLHMSPDHARRTAYGQRVVFGVLAAIEALRRGPERRGRVLRRLVVEFPNPVFVGVDYQVRHEGDGFVLADGRRVLVRGQAEYQAGSGAGFVAEGNAPTSTAADQQTVEIGQSTAGDYTMAGGWPDLAERGVSAGQVAALLWSSYLVGMELPGRRALFSKATFEFTRAGAPSFAYQAEVTRFHKRFGRLKIAAELTDADGVFATVELEAFLRADVPVADVPAVAQHLPPSDALAGRSALVVGGSRGLGAALARGLALQGANVRVGYARSRAAAEALAAEAADAPGEITLVQGDAADPAWCQAQDPPDILVCSAFPALLPLWVEPTALARITDFMHRAWALTATPLACLAPALAERGGTLVTVSTIAVEDIVPDWPHYTAAKFAVEGLTRATSAEYPELRAIIARLPKMWTDLTNTPLGRHGAVPVEVVAGELVQQIIAAEPGLTLWSR